MECLLSRKLDSISPRQNCILNFVEGTHRVPNDTHGINGECERAGQRGRGGSGHIACNVETFDVADELCADVANEWDVDFEILKRNWWDPVR